jgi:hypothetical protein
MWYGMVICIERYNDRLPPVSSRRDLRGVKMARRQSQVGKFALQSSHVEGRHDNVQDKSIVAVGPLSVWDRFRVAR